jgi:hypothetical protein
VKPSEIARFRAQLDALLEQLVNDHVSAREIDTEIADGRKRLFRKFRSWFSGQGWIV